MCKSCHLTGFLTHRSSSIKARSLPRFWFFSFHYMDYQKYAFELLSNVRLIFLALIKVLWLISGSSRTSAVSPSSATQL